MAGDICAESSLPAASGLCISYGGDIYGKKTSHSHSPSHSSHFYESPEQTELAPLSRSASVSSLSSAYSTSSTDSSSSTESSSLDEGSPIIGILKKPRRQFPTYHSNDNNRNGTQGNDDYGDEDKEKEEGEGEEGEEEEEDCWEDEESECDIIFERSVTFNDPIATDIVSGVPVSPSPHSRVEWTALRARACLERMRKVDEGDWVDCEDEEDDNEKDVEEEGEEEEDDDKKDEAEEMSGELQYMRKLEQKDWNRGGRTTDADVEDLVFKIMEQVVRHIEQQK